MQSIENGFNIDDGRKTTAEKNLNEIKGSLEEKENLNDISPLTQTHTPVMTVTSAVGGNIYLKGTAYADYRDNTWSIISDNDAARYPQDFVPFTATIGNNALTDTRVHMLNESKIAYVPYFLESLPDNLNSVADVCVKTIRIKTNLIIRTIRFMPKTHTDTIIQPKRKITKHLCMIPILKFRENTN